MDLDYFLQNYVANSTQHNCFYHFTDRSNLDLIRLRHLLSMRNAKSMGVDIPTPGGNQLSLEEDRRTGMDGYVHLAMTMDHPMAYVAQQQGRLKDIVWLRINPRVIKLPGVLLTSVVSNSAGMVPLQPTDVDKLDLEVVYKRLDWRDGVVMDRLKIARKYEILVPNYIHLNEVKFP